MLRTLSILLVTDNEQFARSLGELLQEHIVMTHVRSLPELQAALQEELYDALFCDWVLPHGTWRDALEGVRGSFPDLPVIILSRTGGEREWMQVLEAGAFDLLVPPYGARVVLSLVEHAIASRDARYGWKSANQPVAKAS